MLPLKIALATFSLKQPVRQSIKTAASLGVQGVHLDTKDEVHPRDLSESGRRQFLHYLEELSLKVASLKFPSRRGYANQEQLEARIDATKQAMNLAWALKGKLLTVRIGKIPAEADAPERIMLTEVINELARYGNQVGVTLAITPSGDTPGLLRQFLDQITLGPIGVNFDPAAFIISRQDPLQAFRTLHEKVLHVMVRDAVRDGDDGGYEVPVGRGEVDWDEFLALLDEASYHGWLTIDRSSSEDPAADATRAIQFLKRVATG